MSVISHNGIKYFVSTKLTNLWEKHSLKNLKEKNFDRVYIIDGRERLGKSTFAIQQMGFIEPSVFENVEKFVSRICFTAEEFNECCRKVKNGVIIFDEAFRGLSSRTAMSKVNKKLIQTLMEMGQNNNIVFIVLPSFFLLDLYPAMIRSDGLFRITESKKDKRRIFYGYNKKDKNRIYQLGMRKWGTYKIPTLFSDPFPKIFPGGKEYEAAYLKKKQKAFMSEEKPTQRHYRTQNDTRLILPLINYAYELTGSSTKLEKALRERGVKISDSTIFNLVKMNRLKK